MTIDDRPAPALGQGEELGPPVLPVTQTANPMRRFWTAVNLSRRPGRGGSTGLRHVITAAIGFFLLTALAANMNTYYNVQVASFAAYFCAAAGLTVLIGMNGQLSLGHGAIMAVGGYTFALLEQMFFDQNNTAMWTVFVSLAASVAAAMVAGLIIGVAAARLRGPYLAGVTLAVALIVPSITTYFRDTFKGDQGLQIAVPPQPNLGPAFTMEQWQTWVAGGFALLVLLLLANLSQSRIGRNFRAVRDDEIAAQLSGIHVARTQVVAFVVSAATAGLGGGLLAFVLTSAQPGEFGLNLSLYLFLAIIIGGLGSLIGAVWGALIITFLPVLTSDLAEKFTTSPEMNQKLNGNLGQLIFGAVLVVVMIVAPGGVQGLLYRVRRWSVSLFTRGARR